MGQLDPQLLLYAGLRTLVQPTYLNEYVRAAQNLKYQRFAKVMPATALEMHFPTLIEDAKIEDVGENGGEVQGREQAIGDFIFRQHVYKSLGRWNEFQFKDLSRSGNVGGEGIDLMQQHIKNHSAAAAYLPQKLLINTLRNGTASSMTTENGNTINLLQANWDNLPLFSASHLVHPKKSAIGTFSNYWSYTSGGTWYPLGGPFGGTDGAYSAGNYITPIQALQNLYYIIAQIMGIKMSDGVTPRYLRPTTLICGPSLMENVTLITGAKFLAGAASSSIGGTTDVTAAITRLGQKEPVILEELAYSSQLTANENWDWYLLCEEDNKQSEIGCLNIGVSEPWNMKLFTPDMMLELAKSNRLEMIGQSRMFVGVGAPHYIFKNEAPRSGVQYW